MIYNSEKPSNSLHWNRTIQYVIVAMLFIAIGPFVFSSSWISSSDFHSAINALRKKTSILIVDDQPANIRALSGIVKEEYTIMVATSSAIIFMELWKL